RVLEKFLELDFDTLSDRLEATSAFTHVLGCNRARHEDSLVNRLESNVDVEVFTLFDVGNALSPTLGDGNRKGVLAHFARLAHDIARGQDKGPVKVILHMTSLR